MSATQRIIAMMATGKLVAMISFQDDQLLEAEDARLQLELDLNRTGKEREVILFEAADETALRKTHRRYFEDLSQLAESPK